MNGEQPVSVDHFRALDLRVGTIVTASPNARAKKPAYVVEVDLGELGVRTSSAQITDNYSAEHLVGLQVVCVCNLPSLRVGGVRSEVLLLGAPDSEGNTTLTTVTAPVPAGGRLS